jgi:uncharacterized membrane protein
MGLGFFEIIIITMFLLFFVVPTALLFNNAHKKSRARKDAERKDKHNARYP